MSLFAELKRRNVVRVGFAYVVIGWILAQVAEFAFENFGAPDWVLKTFVAILLLGLPLALFFAWAFELTPDGVVRTTDVPEGESITSKTGHKLDYAIIAGILVLGAIMIWQGTLPPDSVPSVADSVPVPVTEAVESEPATDTSFRPLEKSIAVLPFANRSPNAEDAFFAEGMHDDLLTHLSKVRDMHVISRTSVMGYADTERKIPEIARELGVATVMEGAVQRSGSRVRINVQLIDAKTDAHLWAEIYDRELTAENVFDIQSEITKAIAAALNAVLSSADEQELNKRPTQSLEAYDAYLEGRLHLLGPGNSIDPYQRAIDEFDRAIGLDPGFAAAYAGKGYAQISAYWYTAAEGPWREEALESIRQAEALAPDAVETLTVRGYYHYWGFLDYETANAAFRSALEKAPSYIDAIAGRAYSMRREGRFEEATLALEKAHRVDPLSVDVALSLGDTYSRLGRFEDARTALRRAKSIAKSGEVDQVAYSYALRAMGDAEGGWKTLIEPTTAFSVSLFEIRVEHAIATRTARNIRMALETWPEEFRRSGDAPDAYEIARARALLFLGENEEAQRLLRDTRTRVDAAANSYPQGWKPNAVYWPVELPGYMGDLDGVRAAVADYEANALPDAWGAIEVHRVVAAAFARAGDPDSAFSYLERMKAPLGPWVYAELSLEEAFDPVRDDPRWQMLKTDYEAWAAETGQ